MTCLKHSLDMTANYTQNYLLENGNLAYDHVRIIFLLFFLSVLEANKVK
jgi:hypothetical protein